MFGTNRFRLAAVSSVWLLALLSPAQAKADDQKNTGELTAAFAVTGNSQTYLLLFKVHEHLVGTRTPFEVVAQAYPCSAEACESHPAARATIPLTSAPARAARWTGSSFVWAGQRLTVQWGSATGPATSGNALIENAIDGTSQTAFARYTRVPVRSRLSFAGRTCLGGPNQAFVVTAEYGAVVSRAQDIPADSAFRRLSRGVHC